MQGFGQGGGANWRGVAAPPPARYARPRRAEEGRHPLRFRAASVLRRSAFRRMKPEASFWS